MSKYEQINSNNRFLCLKDHDTLNIQSLILYFALIVFKQTLNKRKIRNMDYII